MSYTDLITYTQDNNKNMMEFIKYIARVMIYYISPKYDHSKLADVREYLKLDGENLDTIKPPSAILDAAWASATQNSNSK